MSTSHPGEPPNFEDDADFYDPDCGEFCSRCGGEGFIEYMDAPDTWGEDCPSEENHLITCPDCGGLG